MNTLPEELIKKLHDHCEETFCEVGLTPKEADIARLLLAGLTTKEMSGFTGNTEKTLKHHIASVFEKCDVDSRAQLFATFFPVYFPETAEVESAPVLKAVGR
jgi:DNA-binding CsgD family transcriptional regulator